MAAQKISLAEFLKDWERGLIHEVTSTANRIYGKSVKGQAENPQGYIMVYADAGEPIKRPRWKFWQRG